jgi:5-methyltetrahydrofolate--homocysteine methyltransferase
VATMTFEPTPRGYFTVMGVAVDAAVSGLVDAGADVVGSNCGTGIEHMVRMAGALSQVSRRPLAIQPNAGLPETLEGRIVYRQTPDEMAAHVPELLAAGVMIVGSCCGTTPEHTRAIRRAVDAWSRRT